MRFFAFVALVINFIFIWGCETPDNQQELIRTQQALIQTQRETIAAQNYYIYLLEEMNSRQELLITKQDSLNILLIKRLTELDSQFKQDLQEKYPEFYLFKDKKPTKKLFPLIRRSL